MVDTCLMNLVGVLAQHWINWMLWCNEHVGLRFVSYVFTGYMRLTKTRYLTMYTFESMQRGGILKTLSTVLVWGGAGLVGSIVV